MDYLEEAKELLDAVRLGSTPQQMTPQAMASCAIACALVALIERLDALTDYDGGKSLFVTTTR